MTIPIWGHRGCRGPFNPPENSLAAFQAAIDQGAGGIELDLFASLDGHLVVFHDDTLERMTDGTGDITHFTLAQLKQLHLKGPDGKLTSERIPTYEEVLDLLERRRAQHPEKPFILDTEIKGPGIASLAAQAIKKRIRQGWRREEFLVSSFDMQTLRELRAVDSSIPVGTLFVGGTDSADITEAALAKCINETRDIAPQSIHITLPSITPATIRLIEQESAKPIAWTYRELPPEERAGDLAQALKLLETHHIILITDYPREMMEFVAEGERP
jgi:glycerophosphoryl diester phosphodiesterase